MLRNCIDFVLKMKKQWFRSSGNYLYPAHFVKSHGKRRTEVGITDDAPIVDISENWF